VATVDGSQFFTCLPRERYVEQEWFDLEMERVFGRQWLYVGHVSQVPEAGSYFVRDVGPESMIIVRGDDGDVRAFFNVCRHRGYRICGSGSGQGRRFTCPYHQWTFGLDGALRGVPSMPNGKHFNYTDYPLHSAHCEVWHGMIFIHLGTEEPDPLAGHLAQWDGEMARLEPERMKLAAEINYEVKANWKAVLDNFQECYHCAENHVPMCEVVDLNATFGLLQDHLASEYTVGGLPLKQGAKSLSPDGDWISSKLLGEFGRGVEPPDGFNAGFMIHPTVSYALFYADHGFIQAVRPVDKNTTRWENWWFVREDAVEGEDYSVEALTAVMDLVVREDIALIERTQQGINSVRFVPGPNSVEREPGIRAALQAYHQLMERV